MAEAYDPTEVDERPRSAYLSRKDVKILGIVAIALALLLTPIVWLAKENRDKYVCKTNMGQIFKAMGIYMEQNNDRFPPVFVVGENGEPNLFDGHPYSWMSLIHEGMGERYSFNCPSASDEETIKNLHPDADKPPFRSSYGMYTAWSTYNAPMLVNPNTAVLVAETSNNGANETFDPLPFSHGVDGIVMGWNDSNDKPTRESETITRLAFPDSKDGNFKRKGKGRHGDVIHVLFASGQLGTLHPDAARVQRIGTEIIGRWADR